jgi:cleavage and polyadenylation specificity factor subunit 2
LIHLGTRTTGPGAGIAIVPHNAGHTLGGTIWKIFKDNEEILYAVRFNHKKERLLNPFVPDLLGKSTIMITDTYNAQSEQVQRKQRDNDILGTDISLRYRGRAQLQDQRN